MPRVKQYNTIEVIEKAMHLFWENGYENTSVRMLEQEMGINQFSIYAGFGSKEGLFLESLKSYKEKISSITDILAASNNGIEAIKEYFYAFLKFSKFNDIQNGCLITNTANEVTANKNVSINNALTNFTSFMKSMIVEKIQQEGNRTLEEIEELATYLLISLMSLANSSKIYSQKELHIYIEQSFKNI